MADYRSPTDVDIERLTLITSAGAVHELNGITNEINIYESLFAHFMKCDLVIDDATGMLNSFSGFIDGRVTGGFVGGEILLVSYKTRGNNPDLKLKNHVFVLYECSNRTRVNEDRESYLLRGLSLEAYTTVGRNISKAYGGKKGNLISKIVQSVIDEFVLTRQTKSVYNTIGSSLKFNISKQVNIDPTTGLHKLIMPDYTVDECLDLLCKEADNDTHVPYYIFYENAQGFQFRDLKNLVKQETKEKFTYKQSNAKENDQNITAEFTDRTKIMSIDVERQTNVLHNAQKGLFSSSMTTIDLLQKTKNTTTFKYETGSSKFEKLQNQSFKINGFKTFDTGNVGYLTTTRKGHDSSSFFRSEAPIIKRIDDFYLTKHAYQTHIFNTVVSITVPGDSLLTVGDIIYLEIPVATSIDDRKNEEDKYVSGRYLITELRQKLPGKTGQGHVTSIRCVKDTGIKIP